MRFIEAGFERFSIPEPFEKMEVLKHLEKIGRVCYKSEDKITDESCIKYLNNIRDRKHWAMLEHYIFAFYIPRSFYDEFYEIMMEHCDDYDFANAVSFVKLSNIKGSDDLDKQYILSASATAINYLWDTAAYNNPGVISCFHYICKFMLDNYSEITKMPEGFYFPNDFEMHDGVKLISRSEMKSMPRNIRLIHDFMTTKFIVDRGVTHEAVRHRPASWAQESTRYVNYGKKGCTYILPEWLSDHDKEVLLSDEMLEDYLKDQYFMASNPHNLSYRTLDYLDSIIHSSNIYEDLVSSDTTNIKEDKWVPQQARSVLSHSTKAELVMTARLGEMKHFFDMRAEGHAHPQMREVAIPLLADCISTDHIIFEDQQKYLV